MSAPRRRSTPRSFVIAGLVLSAALAGVAARRLLADGHGVADGHEVRIREVLAGANGDSRVQFLVIEQSAAGQNLWGPVSTGAQSRAMLVFYDATGREIGIYKFPANPATGGSLRTLVATEAYAALLGVPTPDVTIPPMLNGLSGKVCFKSNPLADSSGFTDCVSYGSFTGDTETNTRNGVAVAAGPPAAGLSVVNTVSLVRAADTGRNADFQQNATPAPVNIAGATATLFVDSQILQGERLFMLETFGGNGRTCATCHVPNQSFGLQPFDVQARFATVSSTYDALFVGEVSPSAFNPEDAGFDYNLNVLTLTAAVPTGAPCTGELRGIITSPSTGGRAKVIARTSSTTYLVGGGLTPALSGAVTDGVCAGTVSSIAAGTLGAPADASRPGLEDPRWMRMSRAANFPQGRALFIENVDQLTLDNVALAVDPRTFRKSPHLLNLAATAPYGFSGDIADLRTFSAGAVKQHNPRSLVRSSGGSSPDFRLPTDDELLALEAFQLAQEFPSGTDPDKYNLDRFATSPAAIRGRAFFFGPDAKCSRCHGGPTLALVTESPLLSHAVGTNGRFDTGIENQTLSGTAPDILPCELGGARVAGNCVSRPFSTPQLFNVKHTAPYFHDASAADLRTAIAFYNSAAFNNSPAGVAVGGIHLPSFANGCAGETAQLPCNVIPDIQAFLESLVARQMSANSTTSQTGLAGSPVTTAPSVLIVDDEGTPVANVSVAFAVATGGGTITTPTVVTDASGVAALGGWTPGAGLNSLTASVEGVTGSPVRFHAFGTTVASSVTTQPVSQTVNAGATVTFATASAGAPAPRVQWQLSTDGGTSWTALTNTAPYSGTTGTTLTITAAPATLNSAKYRAVATNAAGAATSDAATLTVFGAGAATPAALRFSAIKASADSPMTSVTSAQSVAVAFAGASGAWTMSANQPWLRLSRTTGTGSDVVSIGVVDATNTIAGSTNLSATVTLTPARAGIAAVTIPVTLTIVTNTQAPIGQVDTPAQSVTGAQGALAMTGWVVDDVGIQHIRIYRQCLSIDVTAACQTVLGTSVVFVGEASVISGARPDVEALYPTLPAANAAGWGFLILSNLLPDIPAASSSGGGVGTFTLFAIATDIEGNQALLGRTVNDSTPTTVTVANDTIAKPFGAIDTPGQGAAVSGTLNNFGWALTPDPGTGVVIPTSGSTVTVFIDGAPLGTATYNFCRGSVGTTVPAGVLCDDDVSTIFRGDGTRFRNLDAARGPIALRTISTLALTNGLHTISWGVTDSANRSEGIGSRYFNVLNSSADSGTSELRNSGTSPANPGTPGPRDPGPPVYARTGFDLLSAYTPLVTNADGVPQVRIPELGRVELQMPGVTGGAMLVNGEARSLPIGVGIDSNRGLVTWAPGVGYLGTYRLSFEVQGSKGPRVLDVTVAPASTAGEPLRMHLDSPAQGLVLSERSVRVEGWALDPQSHSGAGVGAVHVWARPISAECEVRSAGCAPIFVGVADLNIPQPDVAAAHGGQYPDAGFRLLATLPAGEWEITAYVWVTRTGRFEDARSVIVVVR